MWRGLKSAFLRYTHEHGRLSKPGVALITHSGKPIGHIDAIRLCRGRFEIEGWADADHIALVRGDERAALAPSTPRPDVSSKFADMTGRTPGFRLDLPVGPAECFLVSRKGEKECAQRIDFFDDADMARVRRRLIRPFLGASFRALPAYLRWRLKHHPEDRAAIKDSLGLGEETPTDRMTPFLFAVDAGDEDPASLMLPKETVTIVLPVFNAMDLLPETLDRILVHTDLPFELIIIEDCSTDPAVRPFLRNWVKSAGASSRQYVHLLENEKNLGFIGSVNRGFEKAIKLGHHVLLLNSDAFVPNNWASRLVRPFAEHLRVASVTPMSNDAEIFNAPVLCRASVLAKGVADEIDATAAQFVPDAALADAPTGVGFCMAMHKDALRLVRTFDHTFDPGYGEEVDWCQKLTLKGWRHLGHGGIFVEHRSGTSFGSEKKAKLVAAHNQIVSKRYPDYDQSVQKFIAEDPLTAPRLALALAWAQASCAQTIPVYIGHSMGGGAELYLKQRIGKDLRKTGIAIVIRVGGAHAWNIELHTPLGVTQGATAAVAFVERLMSLIPNRRIIYSCGVGASDLLEIPDVLCRLAASPGSELEILFHDYLPLSPSYTLLNSRNEYAPASPEGSVDPAHTYCKPDGTTVSLAEWRHRWGKAIRHADDLTVFSDSSRKILSDVFPVSKEKIRVMPHAVALKQRRMAPGRHTDGKPVIGVLGAIGLQKGAKILQDLSALLDQSQDAHLVVLGYMDPAFPLATSAAIHGPYEVRDIPELTKRYGVSCWFIPSIWPETFSYTTHEALATGLPVWSFDLGAQADAIKRASVMSGQGGTIPLRPGEPQSQMILDALLSSCETTICPQSQSA